MLSEKKFAMKKAWKSAKEKSAKGKLSGKRSTLKSVSGPPSWRKVSAKHREVLGITGDPPGNERMLLKMQKHVNACVKMILIARRTAKFSRRRATVKRRPFEAQGKQDRRTPKKEERT